MYNLLLIVSSDWQYLIEGAWPQGTPIIGASTAKPHMDDTSGIFHILCIYIYIIDVRRTALILRCGAVRVDLLRMLIVV